MSGKGKVTGPRRVDIITAIRELKDRNGSSMMAIKKHMQAKHPKGKKWTDTSFRKALNQCVAAGDLVQNKNSYKLSEKYKSKKKSSTKSKKKSFTKSKKKSSKKKSGKGQKKAKVEKYKEGDLKQISGTVYDLEIEEYKDEVLDALAELEDEQKFSVAEILQEITFSTDELDQVLHDILSLVDDGTLVQDCSGMSEHSPECPLGLASVFCSNCVYTLAPESVLSRRMLGAGSGSDFQQNNVSVGPPEGILFASGAMCVLILLKAVFRRGQEA
eukprot:CAMPEP_0197449666 /NCGR_PEP_ID=MMETSP1175-20131217/22437_1 /TAXON_ID=1003142 /ORGANISM="Triceratium dubium, Strain CCMP147" /LENGTH=271 /DNA_ID=CAMNT_0042981867 /DNA_START=36 /DNA_END=851 /DNA_ORIENTATION=-